MIPSGNKISGISASVPIYTPRSTRQTTEQKERSAAERFDSVTISGERPASFEAQLRSSVTRQVRACATPGRLNALSEQIAAGEYKPDAMSIARRMLLLPEET